ncbi:MAG: hypothetical protein D6753_15150 [Planctomycetota bacterium]|nr:MAG: hypothetical protein D6753_15150 [Planctomycetota bacterium]
MAIGQVLLWSGFIAGALVSVQNVEIESAPWKTVRWGYYAFAIGVGTAGVGLLRWEKRRHRVAAAADQAGIDAVHAWLNQACQRVSELADKLDDMTCEQVLDYIDHQCVPVMIEFADNRTVIAHRFGTRAFAAIMTEFASGERYLNRAWSAAADGYVDEVERSVGHAVRFLSQAAAEFDKLIHQENEPGQTRDAT